MAQGVGSRFSRFAMRAGTAVGVVGLATVALSLTPVGVPPASTLTPPYAYVVNSDSNTVSVIKTSTNTVVKTVGVGTIHTGSPSPPTGATPTWSTPAPTP